MNSLALEYIRKIQNLLEDSEELVIHKNSFELKDEENEENYDFDVDMIKQMYDN